MRYIKDATGEIVPESGKTPVKKTPKSTAKTAKKAKAKPTTKKATEAKAKAEDE